ncbi:uncharacterized protein MONOS_1233 [Monocercomonoides exilis]|uniref:uncharacterized protein n=1 Tax=Monocercomonoides exilis TaxID=2049356 RepID=UPI003559C072|nr:hypothetical protein MONOS_1233 [Monocercomonoides exilis]|eukprot:MONOS_1233.1-p1 / transcript=MONOS_1233.1 / gene=MONOS_1233 / organism=Monocercomonoides_exilis_PA203 / gene_product=unspecified product / transcript_product=unspecified product / location=Mono_scaffold00021:62119-62745(+) / protein_length=209 / sequence_SO=supercontig / SO=protein_coding / is_pseudo=false
MIDSTNAAGSAAADVHSKNKHLPLPVDEQKQSVIEEYKQSKLPPSFNLNKMVPPFSHPEPPRFLIVALRMTILIGSRSALRIIAMPPAALSVTCSSVFHSTAELSSASGFVFLSSAKDLSICNPLLPSSFIFFIVKLLNVKDAADAIDMMSEENESERIVTNSNITVPPSALISPNLIMSSPSSFFANEQLFKVNDPSQEQICVNTFS